MWTDYHIKTANKRTDTIKNKTFFEYFKKEIVGETFISAERRGKNILIHVSNGKTILIHMKMTGHLLYGRYSWSGKRWQSTQPLLSDPFNQFVHLIFVLSNGHHLAFSDMRKFAKVTLFETRNRESIIDLAGLGPEPLENLSFSTFTKQLDKKPRGPVKTVLMDQHIIAGIGNIYSDEILWTSGIHPLRTVPSLTASEKRSMWNAMKQILTTSIKMGGDSMSDYRNIYGERGKFQNTHKAYRQTNKPCLKKGCNGKIVRKVIGGRSSHFCSSHQK